MQVVPFTFGGLPYFRGEEVRLWNWFHRVFPVGMEWQEWAGRAFSELLVRPAGHKASLAQTNTLEPGQEALRFALDREETSIGRAPENHIVLPAKAIGKSHARILRRDDGLFIEDLGTSFGTQVGGRKLEPNRPEPLRDGDAFVIFPYEFSVSVETVWAPETGARVLAWPAVATNWSVFRERSGPGLVGFPLCVEPAKEPAFLEVSGQFLTELVDRLLQPLRLNARDAALLPCEESLLEFLLLSVLESANLAARFPFLIELGASSAAAPYEHWDRGISAAFSVALSGLSGEMRLFLPYAVLADLERAAPAPEMPLQAGDLAWELPVSAGWVDLLPRELRGVEPLDILLITSEAAVWIPGTFERGWKARVESDNPWRIRIDNYVDGSARMTESTDSPDLGSLPVRLHVVVGQKELTLDELNGLAPDTILELGTGKTDPVRLAVNGKIMGRGELVEVDGKLGVRVLSWS